MTMTENNDSLVTTSTMDSNYHSQSLYDAGMIVWKMSPVSIALGTFGNLMIFAVLCERNKTRSSMSVYFMVLAMVDLTGIYFNLTLRWLKYHFNVDVRIVHVMFCKVSTVIRFGSSTMSAWTLVVMVTQRTLSVFWHHKLNLMLTNISSRLVIVLLIVLSVLVNGHHFIFVTIVTMKVQNATVSTSCNIDYDDTLTTSVFDTWVWISSMTSSFLPFVILFVDNVILIRHVRRSTSEARVTLAVGSQQQIKVREKKATSMTVTLIATSVTFLVMTFPFFAVETAAMLLRDTLFSDVALFELLSFLWSLFTFLWCSHQAVNFYLYCLTGTRFRARAREILCGCKTNRSDRTRSMTETRVASSGQPVKVKDVEFPEDF